MRRWWKKLWLACCAGAAGAALLSGGTASAQDPNYEALRQRLERLEQQNEELRRQIQARPAAPVAVEGGAMVDRKEVEQIIGDYLKNQEADKKKKEKSKADEWYEVGTDMTIKTTLDGGHPTFTTPNKDFQFAITGRLHMDAGWFSGTPDAMPNFQDGTSVRRARIGFQGRVWENIFFRTAYDFADPFGGGPFTNFRDAYIRIEKVPFVENIQIGQMKEPLSLSWMSTSNQLPFLERPLPVNAFIPDRNTGVYVFRNFGRDDRVYAATSYWFQQGNAGAFSNGDGQYAWTSRITGLPYWSGDGRCLVHVGGGYSRRAWDANEGPRFRDVGEARIGTQRLVDTGFIRGATDHNLYNAEFAAVWGPVSFQAEYMAVDLVQANGTPLDYHGYYAMVSWFLTGENRRYDKKGGGFTTVKPHENFFFMRGEDGRYVRGIGAWELTARWSYIDVSDPNLFVMTNADRSGGTGTLGDLTFGLNWYLNQQTTLQFNYIRSHRDSDTPNRSGDLDTFAMRLRFWF